MIELSDEYRANDAAGRPIRVGEEVGGTTSGRYQDTVIGNVLKIGKGSRVKIRVDSSTRGAVGDEIWIYAGRVFKINP